MGLPVQPSVNPKKMSRRMGPLVGAPPAGAMAFLLAYRGPNANFEKLPTLEQHSLSTANSSS